MTKPCEFWLKPINFTWENKNRIFKWKKLWWDITFPYFFQQEKHTTLAAPLPTQKLMKKIAPKQKKPSQNLSTTKMNKESISCTNRDFTTTTITTTLPVLLLSILSSFCQLTRFLYIGFCEKNYIKMEKYIEPRVDIKYLSVHFVC